MKATYLKAYVGRGTKLHIGYQFELSEGRKMLRVKCGSRQAGMRIYTAGELDLTTYVDNGNNCEKCLDRVKEEASA